MIANEARRLWTELKSQDPTIPEFKASKGYVWSFLKRNNFVHHKAKGYIQSQRPNMYPSSLSLSTNQREAQSKLDNHSSIVDEDDDDPTTTKQKDDNNDEEDEAESIEICLDIEELLQD